MSNIINKSTYCVGHFLPKLQDNASTHLRPVIGKTYLKNMSEKIGRFRERNRPIFLTNALVCPFVNIVFTVFFAKNLAYLENK